MVDDAHILSAETINSLSEQLENYERGSGNQVFVATVASLQGNDIAAYSNDLFRAWHIGQKDKNNGALLVVAPSERKVRIEVGYGLEGDLTDAQSSLIIQQIIQPAFKAGAMDQGVVAGTQAMLQVLGGESIARDIVPTQQGHIPMWLIILFVLFFMFGGRSFFWGSLLGAGLSGFGRSSGGFGGGSFGGGGGGSSGGGGASGSW